MTILSTCIYYVKHWNVTIFSEVEFTGNNNIFTTIGQFVLREIHVPHIKKKNSKTRSYRAWFVDSGDGGEM